MQTTESAPALPEQAAQFSRSQLTTGLSRAYINKQLQPGFTFADGETIYTTTRISRSDFARRVTINGHRFTPGHFRRNYRKNSNFQCAWLLVLDLDDDPATTEELANYPFFAQYAAIIYRTPSYTDAAPRHRIVFFLDAPLDSVERFREAAKALIAELPFRIDPNSAKAAQAYYGSIQPGAIIRLENTLPLKLLGELTYEAAVNDFLIATSPRLPTIVLTGSRAEAYAAATYERILGDLERTSDNRNDALFNAAVKLFSRALGGWHGFSESKLEDDLYRAMERNGYTAAKGVSRVKSTIQSARQSAIAIPLELSEDAKHEKGSEQISNGCQFASSGDDEKRNGFAFEAEPPYMPDQAFNESDIPAEADYPDTGAAAPAVQLPSFTPDRRLHSRYLSDVLNPDEILNHRATLIKSPINTGKTFWLAIFIKALARHLGRAPRILFVTHRTSLARDLSRNMSERTGLPVECYLGLDQDFLPLIDQLVISINSLHKLKVDRKLPTYDLVVIDEIAQFLWETLTTGTMQNDEPADAYVLLQQVIKQADRFVGLDAHLSDKVAAWVKAQTKTVVCIENTFVVPRGKLFEHEGETTVLAAALSKVQERVGPIVVPCATRELTYIAGQFFKDAVEGEVWVINGENSADAEIQQLIEQLNERLPNIAVLVYNSSLGTGIDITCKVAGVYMLMPDRPLSPGDGHQLMGRPRNADEYHAWVEDTTGNYETDAAVIQAAVERKVIDTHNVSYFGEHNIESATPLELEMLTLESQLGADRNRAMNQPLAYFRAMATGYTVSQITGENDHIREMLKEAAARVKDQRKTDILKAEPIDRTQLEQHRREGTLTPAIRAGHELFKILDTVGRDKSQATPELYDDAHTPKKRDRIVRFTELETDAVILQEQDRREAARRVMLSRRKHHYQRRRLVEDVITAVWIDLDAATTLERSAYEITLLLEHFLDHRRDDLIRVLNWRPDQSESCVSRLRWILEKCGLKLTSRQVMVEGQRYRVYKVDPDRLAKMRDYSRTRRAHLEQKAAEAAAVKSAITQNVYKDSSAQFEQLPPIAPVPTYVDRQLAAGVPVNPFAANWRIVPSEVHAHA